MSSPYVFRISNDICMPEGGLKSKAMIQNALKAMFKGEQFKCAEEEEDAVSMLLGSHSIQKYTATCARRCGVTKDEKDIRGRWKGPGRVSNIYNCHTPMQRLLKSCVVVVLASICTIQPLTWQ